MKDYELYSQLKLPKNSKIVIRLDGRSFHSLSGVLNLNKPYDERFISLMVNTSSDLFKEFSPSLIYTFSDEINILLNEIPFSARVEKLDSVLASFASSSFSLNLNNYFDDIILPKPIAFDSRVVLLPKEDILTYFKWRQDEAWRNCVNSYGITFLKSKYSPAEANDKIKGMNLSDIHELLFKNGINLNNVDCSHKRGVALYRQFDSSVIEDYNIPIFTNNFINKFI